jgi:gas vesicle protein
MTSTTDYATTTRSAEKALTTALDSWKDGLSSLTDQFRAVPSFGALPQVDGTQVVERQFAFIKQVVDLNRQYALNLAQAFNDLNGVTREHFDQVGSALRDQVQAVSGAVRSSVDDVEQAARSQADRVEQEQAQAAKDAAKAERQARKEAHDQARARYEGLNKTELTDELGRRDLAKTGTVDELIERLVADDQK